MASLFIRIALLCSSGRIFKQIIDVDLNGYFRAILRLPCPKLCYILEIEKWGLVLEQFHHTSHLSLNGVVGIAESTSFGDFFHGLQLKLELSTRRRREGGGRKKKVFSLSRF